MLLRVPDFYDSFRCIAGKCTDTCCIGWEIDIDETSAARYANVKGNFGNTLRENIEDGHFKLLPGDRCPFLRQDGLCDMICHLGESSLCDICREHPRFVEVYGDILTLLMDSQPQSKHLKKTHTEWVVGSLLGTPSTPGRRKGLRGGVEGTQLGVCLKLPFISILNIGSKGVNSGWWPQGCLLYYSLSFPGFSFFMFSK